MGAQLSATQLDYLTENKPRYPANDSKRKKDAKDILEKRSEWCFDLCKEMEDVMVWQIKILMRLYTTHC